MRKLLPVVLFPATIILVAFTFQLHANNVSAATNHIVISQIEVGSTTASDEFVELYNPTANDVNLANWRLSRKAGASQANLVTTVSGTIKSHGYFLIGSPTYSGSVTKDLTYSTSSTVANNNTVILYSDAGVTVVDLVGIGTSAPASESAATASPPNSGSVQRMTDENGGHGTDTDNNSSDFEVLVVSNPRNSSVVITPTPTLEPTATPTPTAEPTASPTPSPEPSPTTAPSPTTEPSPTPSPSPEPSATPTFTQTPSPTLSPTPTLTPSLTPTPTPTGATVIFTFPHLSCTLTYIPKHFFSFIFLVPSVSCNRI